MIIYMGNPKDEEELEGLRGIKYCNPNNMFSEVHILMPNTTVFSEKHNSLVLNGNAHLYFFRKQSWLSNLIFLKALMKSLEIIRERKIDIIRAYNPHFCGLVGILAGKLTDTPCVISIHSDLKTLFEIPGVNYLFRSKILTEAIERYCLRNAKLILIQAKHMREYLSKKYKIPEEKFHRIKVMVEKPKDIIWNPDPGYFTIIFVGRLDEQKNPFCLLRAFKLVKSRIPNARLWMVGDGKLTSALKNHTGLNGLEDVSFFGRVRQDMVFKLLSQSHVFVHPGGKGEGFSNTILEAQSIGLPVLITDAYPNDKYICKEKLAVFKYDDAQQCADKLCQLYNNRVLFETLKENSFKNFISYSKDNPLEAEEMAYREALIN